MAQCPCAQQVILRGGFQKIDEELGEAKGRLIIKHKAFKKTQSRGIQELERAEIRLKLQVCCKALDGESTTRCLHKVRITTLKFKYSGSAFPGKI